MSQDAARSFESDPQDGTGAPEPEPGERGDDTARALDLPVDGTVLGLCVDDHHEVWVGRARVRWEGVGEGEAWLPVLKGVVVREGDRVLVSRPANLPEPVVVGVLDGLRRRQDPPPRPAAGLTLRDDESVRVDREDGTPLLEISRGEAGSVVRLLSPDLLLSTDGDLAIRARTLEFEAREGEVRIRAEEDVVVQGEIVRLN